jgi:hypothetical protein
MQLQRNKTQQSVHRCFPFPANLQLRANPQVCYFCGYIRQVKYSNVYVLRR